MDLKNHHTFSYSSMQILLSPDDFVLLNHNYELQVSDTAKGAVFTHPDGMLELIVNWTSDSNIITKYVVLENFDGSFDTVEIEDRIPRFFTIGQVFKLNFLNDSVLVCHSQDGVVDTFRSFTDYSLMQEY